MWEKLRGQQRPPIDLEEELIRYEKGENGAGLKIIERRLRELKNVN